MLGGDALVSYELMSNKLVVDEQANEQQILNSVRTKLCILMVAMCHETNRD